MPADLERRGMVVVVAWVVNVMLFLACGWAAALHLRVESLGEKPPEDWATRKLLSVIICKLGSIRMIIESD